MSKEALLAEYGQLSIDIELEEDRLKKVMGTEGKRLRQLAERRKEVYQSIQMIKSTPKTPPDEPSGT